MQAIASHTAEMGHIIGEFGWNKKRAKLLLIIYGIIALPISLMSCLFIVGFFSSPVVLWLIIRSICRLKSSRIIISLYEKGLIDNRNGDASPLFYRDISKIYVSPVSMGGQTFYDYTVHTYDGSKPIKFSIEIANTKQFGEAIQEGILATQLQQHLIDLENGASIPFDRLSLSAEGLAFRKKKLDWQDFSHAEIKRNRVGKSVTHWLEIYQKGQSRVWKNFERNRFPNLFLFFNLVDHLSQERLTQECSRTYDNTRV
ncbi:MAG: DUF6585 family protein [Cyanobacteria bacterium P01_B01_bin.77]